MLWTTLRWNWGNTLAVAAFCLLPVIGLVEGGLSDKMSAGTAPSVELQSCGLKVAALPNVRFAEQVTAGTFDCA